MSISAARAPMRPIPIALSIVEILSINMDEGLITLTYTDANDGIPVLNLIHIHQTWIELKHPKYLNGVRNGLKAMRHPLNLIVPVYSAFNQPAV